MAISSLTDLNDAGEQLLMDLQYPRIKWFEIRHIDNAQTLPPIADYDFDISAFIADSLELGSFIAFSAVDTLNVSEIF